MKIIIINGPNLNLLGQREKHHYGDRDFESFFNELKLSHPDINLHYFQSNHEGLLVDKIHEVGFDYDGIIINAGALTHTSIALRDALSAVKSTAIEVHISNVHTREDFRHKSYLSGVCKGVIIGFGLDGYRLALESFKTH